MKKYLFLLALSLATACSNAPSRPKAGAGSPGGANGSNGGASGSNEGGGVIGGENSGVPITYAPSPGSAMRLVDGRALTLIYQRIFPKRDYGFEICKGNANFKELSDCSESMFTPDERPFVGTVDIYTPRLNRGPQNLRQPEDLTLNYMRTVRVGLSRECEALVVREHAAFLQNK
ncbi:MAG: hypothetical protein EOP07_21070, partial [Proteobacteria bacterium]